MRSLTRVVAVSLVGLVACIDSTDPSKGGGLLFVMPSSSAGAIDSGHIVVTGPTSKTVTAVPGASVKVDGLDPGTYTVTLEGFVPGSQGGGVGYFTQITGVSVVAGQNATPTVPAFTTFQSAIVDMPTYTVDGTFTLVYSSVAGAASYIVQRDTLATFATARDTTIAAGNTTATISVLLTKPSNVRVLAVTPSGARGQPSTARVIAAVTQVTVTPGTATIAAGATQTFTAVAKDAGGNTVTGVSFFWASSNHNVALVNQAGVATGAGGGTATITAVGLGLPGSAALTVSAVPTPVATKLAFTVQPSNAAAGTAISPAIQVEVQDASGNRVSTARDAVSLAISTGTLSGTSTVNAINGVATFSGLSINNPASGYTLAASSGTLTGATSTAFDITTPPVSPVTSTVAVSPGTGTMADGLSQAVITVTLRDANFNPISGQTVQLGATGTGVTLTQPSGTTNAGGVATGIIVSTVFGAKTVSATVNPGPSAVTLVQSPTVTFGASRLVFTTQPPNTVSGSITPNTTRVSYEDAAGNVVTTATQPVTISISPHLSGASIYGTTTVAAVSGVALFNDYGVDFPGNGYSLSATSGGLTPGTSGLFNVTSSSFVLGSTTLVTASNCDDCAESVLLPFNFSFYGVLFGSIQVSSNGFAAFSATGVSAFTNTFIPNASAPNGVVAPFWDDFNTTDAFCGAPNGAVLTVTAGVAPNRTFVIEYRGVSFFGLCGTVHNFDLILYETSGDIEFRYTFFTLTTDQRGSGSSASIGIENTTGTVGVQAGFNEAGIVQPGEAMRFRFVNGNYVRVR